LDQVLVMVAQPQIRRTWRFARLLFFSGWCGLVAGLLEVAVRLINTAVHPVGHLIGLSRHFVWLAPLSNFALFLTIGSLFGLASRLTPRVVGWLAPRLLCALTILPALMIAGLGIYPAAWLVLGFGLATCLIPWLARSTLGLDRFLWWSFPVLVLSVAGLACSIFLNEQLKKQRAGRMPLPEAMAPNVLLIVLDTVRADHLSAYGYRRPTTPNIDRLAARGIRFDEARAAAPWTLPSHATMFTGRWPHELATEWQTPLLARYPTLAEYLGDHGYATAGFVGNVNYCSYATGLDRGFTYYEDYELPRLAALRTAVLVEYAVSTFLDWSDGFESGPIGLLRREVFHWLDVGGRKHAESINRSFIAWMSGRQPPRRPFFAFLNYIDAHACYIPPPGTIHRFGFRPQSSDESWIVYEQWPTLDRAKLRQPLVDLARDSYDDCLGYLDDQIGWLIDELTRRGELDRTLLIVTSDHGEGFGEHDLFDHGESLYRTEVHVPLVIVPPGHDRGPAVVRKTVSLRDLPATVVDLVGLAEGSPLLGRSLSSTWRNPTRSERPGGAEPVLSELSAPSPLDPNRGRSPARQGPLISIADGDFVYIRNERDASERLFDVKDDPRELTDRAQNDKFRAVLEHFRYLYDQSGLGPTHRAARDRTRSGILAERAAR
jgi:arylsulfatase A-like enzyme